MPTPETAPDPWPEDEPDLFDEVDEAAEAEADARAEEDIKAGRVVSNEAVMRWVASWGTPNPLPRPKCGE